MIAPPEISLPQFAGPLDLLLTLVRKNEVEITDIPIAEITRQYLDYLHQAEELNLDLGSEFVYMAALLIQIKSRCLLASDPEIAAREEDPRQELVRQLLHHEQVRQGAEFLQQKLEIAQAAWSRSSMAEFGGAAAEELPEPAGALSLLQVLRMAQQALATARAYELVTPADSISVEEMMGWLEERIGANQGPMEAGALLAEQPDAAHRMALFLAMLEMSKAARIWLEQDQCFGPIAIVGKHPTVSMAHLCPNVKDDRGSRFS
ncbi:MAG: segregation/condensation protein A [Acidobacteriia bacterium]|nr:segregation/condensation protein A [Terriglobia bacterium]